MIKMPEESWQKVLQEEFGKEYFKDLQKVIQSAYDSGPCYPPEAYIFEAFRLCPFDRVNVVILGQDPYHQPGQAHGLSFSVYDGVKFPPSLRNIFKEVINDTQADVPLSGNLERWAKQGVLLLNDTLTVSAGKPGSHKKLGWEKFTQAVISILSLQKQNLVFMLWGTPAKLKGKIIDRERHLVLESGHPSPMSANRGHWFANSHFSKANTYLAQHGNPTVKW